MKKELKCNGCGCSLTTFEKWREFVNVTYNHLNSERREEVIKEAEDCGIPFCENCAVCCENCSEVFSYEGERGDCPNCSWNMEGYNDDWVDTRGAGF